MKHSVAKTVKFHAFVRHVSTEAHAAPREPKLEEIAVVPAQDQAAKELTSEPAVLTGLLEEINEGVRGINAARSQNIGELQEAAIELAVAIASHLVKEKLDANQLNLNELVQSAVEHLLPAEKISITINPLDQIDLEEIASGPFLEIRENMGVLHDVTLPRGACIVADNEHGLFSTLETRLEHIRDTLLQGIEYARIERRTVDGTGSALRRFPDRRKLA